MRLTNIAQMVLPHGRVHSYAVITNGAVDGALPVSFDQGRHVGEGDRAGSWMALAARLPADVTRQSIGEAWMAVVARHDTLRTAFSLDGSTLALNRITVTSGAWHEHDVPAGAPTREVVRAILDANCRPFAAPSHRICLIEPDESASDPRPALVIASDHSHVDMWSLLVLLRDLTIELDPSSEPMDAASPFAEHTAALEQMPAAPASVAERWHELLAAGDDLMPVFPLSLGDISTARQEVVEVRDVLDSAGVQRFTARAELNGVRLISLAVSLIATVTREMTGAPLRAVFPVHSRHDVRWHDSVGWFITNAILECADPESATAAVKEAITLGSYPLAPILEPYGGMPATPGMFAFSWLDTRRLPVQVSPEYEVQYVSAVVPTDGVMIWFIVNDTGLHLRCRYPDTPEARKNVGAWIDAVQSSIHDASLAPATTLRDLVTDSL
ncbi:peptide synthetase [Microbacterium sp. NPDC076911]|uniref:peptide synthetase n=1 Tax=Microbacterium sp. NPDC076911 TaxID=3154958 RepID=UPI00341B06DD